MSAHRRPGPRSAGNGPAHSEETAEGRSAWSFAWTLVVHSVREFGDDRCPHLAASIAYRVLLSLFPLAIVLTAGAAVVLQATGQQADVIDPIVRNVPLDGQGKESLRSALEQATSGGSAVGLVGLAGLLWAASGMMGAIRLGLNLAWDVEEPRPFLRGKAIDLMLVLGVALVILLSFTISLTARLVGAYAPSVLGGWLSGVLGLVPPLALGFVAVTFLYTVVPASRPKLRNVWPAALFVALVFVGLQNLFAVYVENFGNYNAVYGSLGAVVAFLAFVYIASLVFLFGAELASEWPHVPAEIARSEDDGEGEPFGRRVLGFLRGLVVRE